MVDIVESGYMLTFRCRLLIDALHQASPPTLVCTFRRDRADMNLRTVLFAQNFRGVRDFLKLDQNVSETIHVHNPMASSHAVLK